MYYRKRPLAGIAAAALLPAVVLLAGSTTFGQAQSAGVVSGCTTSTVTAAATTALKTVNTEVTLVTGEKVRVQGSSVTPVQPASGTGSSAFTTFNLAGDHYVIPAEAVPYLGSLLDPRLFDVSYLVRAKLDDAHSAKLPVSVSFATGRSTTLPGLRTAARGGATLAKSQAAGLGALLAQTWRDSRAGRALPAGNPLAGIRRIGLTPGSAQLPPLPGSQAFRSGVAPKFYTLTVNLIGKDGKPGTAVGYVQNLNDGRYSTLEVDPSWSPTSGLIATPGPLRFSVPQGAVSLVFSIVSPDAGTWNSVDVALVVKPQVQINGDTTITLDARTATPYRVTPPSGASTAYRMDQIYFTRNAGGASCSNGPASMGLLSIGDPPRYKATAISATPTAPVTIGSAGFEATTELYPADFETANAKPNGGPRYFLAFPHAGGVPASLSYRVPRAGLETLKEGVFTGPGCTNSLLGGPDFNMFVYTPWGLTTAMGYEASSGGLPLGNHTDYVYSSDPAQTRWQSMMATLCDPQISDSIPQPVLPGHTITENWDESPIVPSPAGGPGIEGTWRATSSFQLPLNVVPAGRQDNLAFLNLSIGDSDAGHFNGGFFLNGTAAFPTPVANAYPGYLAFWRDGQLVASSAEIGENAPTTTSGRLIFANGTILPMVSQAASYKLRWWIGQPYDTKATTDTVWTFRSGPSGGQRVPSSLECGPDPDRTCSYLPLLFLTYHLSLNGHSQAKAGTPMAVNFTASHQQGEATPSGVSATVSASFDGGKTWSAAVPASTLGGNRFTTTIQQPALSATDGYVALRIHAVDAAGNAVTQTLIRAYQLTA